MVEQHGVMSKIAILYTDHQNDWVKPWKDFAEMGMKIIEQGRELENDTSVEVEYTVFDIYHSQFPPIEELKTANGYRGIYITGSRYDAHDTATTWVNELRIFLRMLLTEDGYPPVAGICFGHQIIASALNAKVCRNPLGLEIGVTPITLNKVGLALFSDVAGATINISELHQDVVEETPEGYSNWGSTSVCERQGFYRPQKAISFQGHPEFHTEASQRALDAKLSSIPKSGLNSYDSVKTRNATLKNDGPYVARYIWKLFKREI
ncbi:hypothetical protein HG535_0G03870 [Zygotorulaspora mrakii]|uniref:Glutamine amidotransferase domain-containing protein n=1 Tax=Zygotorulaspora mrakii TaxID=42260 RepID=A0A7H9B8D3_ZYGMR|nr:uncharacterized protein HG535_0G03870 [Zygotorulaspora mrakii]QLG74504.1 hypothetical protein HG535_0G03870 [Zygotorulaspora mrakii]